MIDLPRGGLSELLPRALRLGKKEGEREEGKEGARNFNWHRPPPPSRGGGRLPAGSLPEKKSIMSSSSIIGLIN